MPVKEKPAKAVEKKAKAGEKPAKATDPKAIPEFLKDVSKSVSSMLEIVELMEAGFEGCIFGPRELYNDIPAIRQSDFKTYITQPMYYPMEKKYRTEKSYFTEGSLFDSHLFDTQKEFDAKYAIGPNVHKNTNVWKDFVAANSAKTIVSQAEVDQSLVYKESFLVHERWQNFTKSEHAFQVIVLKKHECGAYLKAMLDAVNPEMIVDGKLLADASVAGFKNSYIGFGYDIQCAWYRSIFPKLPGSVQAPQMYFACQEKHKYPEAVIGSAQWFQIDGEDIATAMRVINTRLPEFVQALEKGKFSGYTEQINLVKAPVYKERLG